MFFTVIRANWSVKVLKWVQVLQPIYKMLTHTKRMTKLIWYYYFWFLFQTHDFELIFAINFLFVMVQFKSMVSKWNNIATLALNIIKVTTMLHVIQNRFLLFINLIESPFTFWCWTNHCISLYQYHYSFKYACLIITYHGFRLCLIFLFHASLFWVNVPTSLQLYLSARLFVWLLLFIFYGIFLPCFSPLL